MKTATFSPLAALFSLSGDLRRTDGRALSVYLPARPDGYDARYYEIVLGDLRHRYRERLDPGDLSVMDRELPRVGEHLGRLRPTGASALACFAEAPAGLLEVFKLPLRTEERLGVGELLLAPALRQLEQLPPVLVVTLDRERARTFAFILDEVRPLSEVLGDQAQLTLVVAHEVEHAMSSGAYERLYIAGPAAAAAAFERSIAERFRSRSERLAGVSPSSAHLEADLYERLSTERARVAG